MSWVGSKCRGEVLWSGLVLGMSLATAAGCQVEREQIIERDRHAVAQSRNVRKPASAAAPQTLAGSVGGPGDAERIHRWVATCDRQHLIQEWKATKAVLLSELDGHDLQARNAACALIALGQEDCVGALTASLKAHGTVQKAEAYMNSGHAVLREAAATWVCEHGWMAEKREGVSPTTWGSMMAPAALPQSKPTLAIVDLQPGYDHETMMKHEDALKRTLEDSTPKGLLHDARVLQARESYMVTVTNPNRCTVAVGLRSKRDNETGIYEYGKDFGVTARGSISISVCAGEFDIYFVYSYDPTALYQGDSFQLSEGKQCDCHAKIILPP